MSLILRFLLFCASNSERDNVWTVSEVCEHSLSSVLPSSSIHQRYKWAAQLLSAVATLHARGIVHRTLTVQSLMVAADHSIRIGIQFCL
jgi:serine/threonine protein kinase